MKKAVHSGIICLALVALVFSTGCGPVQVIETNSELASQPQTSSATAKDPAVTADGLSKPATQGARESVPVVEFLFSETDPFTAPDYGFAKDFVLPESDTLKLPDDTFDLPSSDDENPTIYQLPIARNEILARHGYVFKGAALQAYFNSKSWYKPDPSFAPEALSPVEKYNRGLLEFYETYCAESLEDSKWSANDPIHHEANQTLTTDLNGDSIPESIFYSTNSPSETTRFCHGVLKINDQVLVEDAYILGDDFEIIDIDVSDPYKEILISAVDEGGSNYSIIYGYVGSQFSNLGECHGFVRPRANVDGSGKFTSSIGTDIFHRIYYYQTYELTQTHQIKKVDQDVYLTKVLLFVKKSFQLFSERDFSKPSYTVPEGSIIRIVHTDTETWCEVETATGKTGWFAADWDTLIYENINATDVLLGNYSGF